MIKINKLDISLLLFSLIISFNLFYNISNFSYSILVIICGSVIGYFFINFYNYLINKKKTSNKILNILEIIILLIISIYAVDKLSLFVSYNLVREINPIYINISLLITIYLLIRNEMKVIIRFNELYIWIFIFLFLIMSLFLIKDVNFNNIKIIAKINGITFIKDVTKYIIITVFPIYYLFNINKDNYKNELKKTYIYASIYILINTILLIGVLGNNYIEYKYPEIIMLKEINMFNIVKRSDGIFLLNTFVISYIFIVTNIKVLLNKINFYKEKKELLNIFIIILIFIFLSLNINITSNTLLILLNVLLVIILFYS